MDEINYLNWGFIPRDTEPTFVESYTPAPPMMTTLAIDKNASLIFQLRSYPPNLHLSIETTAVSAEGRSANLFKVLTSPSGTQFKEVPYQGWDKIADGFYVTFSAQIGNAQEYVKLLALEDPALIVNRIAFAG